MSLDLATLDTRKASNQGVEFELDHPSTGEPLGIVLTVVGTDSDDYKRAEHAATNKRLNKRNAKMTAEGLEATTRGLLVECIKGWTGMVVDGEEMEFTKENARAVLKRFPWIQEQVDQFVGDRRNFIQD